MKSKKRHKAVQEAKNFFQMECLSNQKNISCVEVFLKQISKKLNIDDGTMYRLLVSCTEAVNNAIIHGNKSNPGKKVKIECIAQNKILTISVKDEGEGFNPKILQDPREERNLLKENGRGVFLIRALMDEVKFRKLKSGSVVKMKVKFKK